jgi:DNA-binding beta-propeller fold protein YncE
MPRDGGQDGQDGGDTGPGDQIGDQGPTCEEEPPPCKDLSDCTDTDPACIDGLWVCETGFEELERSCDGLDNDCDGQTDRNLVCTLAGSGEGEAGLLDGTGQEARFNEPRGLAAHSSGGLVVADRANHVLRLITVEGSVTTLAGDGSYGFQDGAALEAKFNEPCGLAASQGGEEFILIADRFNNRIRRLFDNQFVSTVAGNGVADYKDGPAGDASFAQPTGIVVNSGGIIFVADTGNHCIRKIENEEVSVFTGNCEVPGTADGPAPLAGFNLPTDLLLMEDGSLVVTEESSHKLRLVAIDGSVTTLAGTGEAGDSDGEPALAQFRKPAGCVLDADTGLLLVADHGNHRVRALEIDTEVTTYLGSRSSGLEDGPPLLAKFKNPSALAFFPDGRLVIADTRNHVLRILLP